MPADIEARVALEELIEKYLKGNDLDYNRLIEIIQNPLRQFPIRGMLQNIRRFNNIQYTQQKLDLIDNLLYMYG
ncbi:hypothetical protein [Pseudomonas sp. CCNWLW23]|uniref:hypothetical protein n=1 Tax=Pseudomonas sp. CCNWLW23 TaxID=3126385 RepID=UPI0030130C1B